MAAQTQRTVLKEIPFEDPDQFLKLETGAKDEAIQNSPDEMGKPQMWGSLNKPELELASTEGSHNLSGRRSSPRDLQSRRSCHHSATKRNQNVGVSSDFPEVSVGDLKKEFGSRRLEDAAVVLSRVKDPRLLLNNVEGISKVLMTSNCSEVADMDEKHLKITLEPKNMNTEEESELAMTASSQDCSGVITKSSSLESLELSLSVQQNLVSVVGLSNLKVVGKTPTKQDSSGKSSDVNILEEGKLTLNSQHLLEKPAILNNLEGDVATNNAELSLDGSATLNNLEDFKVTLSLIQFSSSLEAELDPAQSAEACDLPTPVSVTTSPEDAAWWRDLPRTKNLEAADGNNSADMEVLINYSRLNNFEDCSGITGLELGCSLKAVNAKERPKRMHCNEASELLYPEGPCHKGSEKKWNCTRSSPRLKRISGVTEELDSRGALEHSKNGIKVCKETEILESKEVLKEIEKEIEGITEMHQTEDKVVVEDQLTVENRMFTDDVCQPMSLRSRRSDVIQEVRVSSSEIPFEETNLEIKLDDSSFGEVKNESQRSMRKADKKLKMKRSPFLHCDWLVGDLLWAKMAGHPWWPCMLTYDPSLGLYMRSSSAGKVVRMRYHVHFFGEKPYHAWIADSAILRYEGLEAFERLCAQVSKMDLAHRSRDYYKVKDSRRGAWNVAVEEAEMISRVSRKSRLLRYNSVSSVDSSEKSSTCADESGRSQKQRGRSMSSEKMEHEMPERKRKRCSEPLVQTRSNTKDPLSQGSSRKLKDGKKNQEENDGKEEPKPEVLNLCGNGGGGGGAMRKGNVCWTCEKEVADEVLVSCEGSCLGSFHRTCLGLAVGLSTPFICDECTIGSHTCFVCKGTSVETVRCSVSLCGRFYHLECVKKLRLANADKRRLQCPLHTCTTCAADDIKNPLASKGSLLRCVRCPVAYHSSDFCLAAGSKRLPGNAVVCSRHMSKSTSQRHVNVNWCFLCSKGGTLLCCESCPAAFHLDCLKIATPPAGSWECEECVDGKRPLCGEIVWAKLGNYRWWPGKICHPRNVPDSLMDMPHQTGEFPVCFFGTHNYFWANIGRVFLFQEDDKGSKDSVRNGLEKSYSRAVQEANAAIRVWTAEKEKRDKKSKAKVDRKPPPYKHLKASTVVGNMSVHRFNLDDVHPCSCHSNMVDPCGPDSKCLNRDLSYECHPDVCPVGDCCQNRRFQRREYVPVVPFKTADRGWGLKTLVDVREGQFVIEYVGELIDHDECRRRIKEMQTSNSSSFYLLTLDKDRVIDAGPRGNVSRFMNHSCQPNCETQKWMVNGDSKIGLFSIVDIPAGSELTFNYNLDCLGNEKLACHCGSAICSGYLGLRPKSTTVVPESSKKKRKRRLKKRFERIHEDDCFRCGKTGQVIMCDKSQCPKVYHLKCLHLTKAPHGKWICPWHHCDECGQPSTQLCVECDNSFCADHVKGNIVEISPGYLICCSHGKWNLVENLSSTCTVEVRSCIEDNCSEKLDLCRAEGDDSELKNTEGKPEAKCRKSQTKRNGRRSSMGICEKNASGKRKRIRERELSTDAVVQSEGGTKMSEIMLKNNVSTSACKILGSKGLKKRMQTSTDALIHSGDGAELSKTEEKTSKEDISCRRKRNRETPSLDFSKKNCAVKRRHKSSTETPIQSENGVQLLGTETKKTLKVSSEQSGNRSWSSSAVSCNGAAKLKRKRKRSSGDSLKVDPFKNEDVDKPGDRKLSKKINRNSKKMVKNDCMLEKGLIEVTGDSVEAGIESTKESRRKSLQLKDTKEGEKTRKVSKKTFTGARASKNPARISKVGVAPLNYSGVPHKATGIQKKNLTRLKCLNLPLKISKTSKRQWTSLQCNSNSSKRKFQQDVYEVLETNVSHVSFDGKLRRSEEHKRRKSGRFRKGSDDNNRRMETEDKTQIKITDMTPVENEATETSLKTHESSRLLLEIPVDASVEIACGSEKEVVHLELTGEQSKTGEEGVIFEVPDEADDVIDEKGKTEEDSMTLKVQDETVASTVKLTKKKVLEKKQKLIKACKRVTCKQSFENKSGSQTETKNLEIKEDKMESQTEILNLELKKQTELQIQTEEIDVSSEKYLKNQEIKKDGLETQTETENLEKVNSHDLQIQVADIKTLGSSEKEIEGPVADMTKNIQNLPDSIMINRCTSHFKTDVFDTPNDSCESDEILLLKDDSPDGNDSKGLGEETVENDSESGSSTRKKADIWQSNFDAISVGPQRKYCEASMDVDSSVYQLDKTQEEGRAAENFLVISKDAVETNVVMIGKAQSVEALLPAKSVGKAKNVKRKAKLGNENGVAGFSKTSDPSEISKLSSEKDDDRTRFGISSVKEPGWKRNQRISSGNTSLQSKEGNLKGCDLFPRTY